MAADKRVMFTSMLQGNMEPYRQEEMGKSSEKHPVRTMINALFTHNWDVLFIDVIIFYFLLFFASSTTNPKS